MYADCIYLVALKDVNYRLVDNKYVFNYYVSLFSFCAN